MKKRLFGDNDEWTPGAVKLGDATTKALEALFAEYQAEGYSLRDIYHVMQESAFSLGVREISRGRRPK